MNKKKRVVNKTQKKNQQRRDFIWYSLRVSFFIMLGLWFVSVIYNLVAKGQQSISPFLIFLSLLWMVSILFTFIVSIIHLGKYKEKAFAIISLIVSLVIILLVIISLILLLSNNQILLQNRMG